MDQLLGDRVAPQRIARDHRGVAEAIRSGWADAGVCLRLTGEEHHLRFLRVREEAYDLCYPEALQKDVRIAVLLQAIQSHHYRQLLDDLPGYSPRTTGELQTVN